MDPFFTLDIGTLMFGGSVTGVLTTGLLWIFWARHRHEIDGIIYWAGSALLLSLGSMLFLFQHRALDFVSVFLANTLVLVGYFLVGIGLRRFHDRPVGRTGWSSLAVLIATIGVFLLFVVTGRPRVDVRIIASTLCIAMMMVYALSSLSRTFVKTLPGRIITGSAAALIVVGIPRVAYTLRQSFGESSTGLVELDLVHTSFLTVNIVASAALLFAFVLLVPLWLQQRKEALAGRIELLYRELRHRVGNDLNVVLNYLELAKESGVDDRSQTMLAQGQSMVAAVHRMHDVLSHRDDPEETLPLDEQIRMIAEQALDSFQMPHVRLEFDLAPTFTDARTLKNCALMVNELITNACKYAFHERDSGAIAVRLARSVGRSEATQRITITVADDGVGLEAPWGSGEARGTGFGQALVTSLADDLGATLDVQTDDRGMRVTWTFETARPGRSSQVPGYTVA